MLEYCIFQARLDGDRDALHIPDLSGKRDLVVGSSASPGDDFKIVNGDFAKKMEAHLEYGWIPFGGAIVSTWHHRAIAAQVMIRGEGAEDLIHLRPPGHPRYLAEVRLIRGYLDDFKGVNNVRVSQPPHFSWDDDGIEARVNKSIQMGWIPSGGLIMDVSHGIHIRAAQLVIKKSELIHEPFDRF